MTGQSESPEETVLLDRSRQGDQEAYGQLIEWYSVSVWNIIARLINNQADAQDVLQETFISAFKALSGFRADSKFSTWLFRIAMNKSKDWLRAHGRQQERQVQPKEDGEDPILAIPDEQTPEKELSNKQMAFHLEKAIQQLPPLYREAFILKHVEGMDYEDMVEIIGVSRDTLKMRVYKARTQLSKELAWLRDDA